jgi:chromosome partitioning protein
VTIITFSHHKGGTGKTTSCLNIAGFCVKGGKKVLVVDCDPQANATVGLGVNPDKPEWNMYDVFMSGTEGFPEVKLENIIIHTGSGIDLVPSHLDLVGVEPYLYRMESRASVLNEALSAVRDRYDVILIDTPPSMGQFVINGLYAADHVIVTLDSGTFALDGLSALTTIFLDIKDGLGKNIRADMAIVSRWGEGRSPECTVPESSEKKDMLTFIRNIFIKPPTPSPEMIKAAEEQKAEDERRAGLLAEIRLRFPLVFTVPHSPAVYEAQKRGMPLSHYAPESNAGVAYKIIADEVMKWM